MHFEFLQNDLQIGPGILRGRLEPAVSGTRRETAVIEQEIHGLPVRLPLTLDFSRQARTLGATHTD
jgi:hypothetical protein